MMDELLEYNRLFVAQKKYEPYGTDKYPSKKLAIVTCMDTRLTTLLPAALGLKNGDAKIIKNAGGTITHPFGSAVRSLLIAVYELKVEEIMVIGHTDCGVRHMDSAQMLTHMEQRGIEKEKLLLAKEFGIDLDRWLSGFSDVADSVRSSAGLLRRHPLMPQDIKIYGFVMDSVTGRLTPVEDDSPAKERETQ